MARLHFVKKARKDQPGGIKAGDSYYWWKFRFGSKHYSKTHPRQSQLTQSEFLSAAYALQEQIDDMMCNEPDWRTWPDELRSVADELRTLGQEQEDKIGNMPDSLQDGEVAERMRGRAEACENVAGELESAANEIEDLIDPDIDIDDPAAADADPAQDIISGISWDVDC